MNYLTYIALSVGVLLIAVLTIGSSSNVEMIVFAGVLMGILFYQSKGLSDPTEKTRGSKRFQDCTFLVCHRNPEMLADPYLFNPKKVIPLDGNIVIPGVADLPNMSCRRSV